MTEMRLKIDELFRAIDGTVVRGGGSATIKGISIDTRRIEPGDLFIAIAGARFDGHDFVMDHLNAGGVGAVVGKGWKGLSEMDNIFPDRYVITVDDTVRAIGDLAIFWRKRHDIPLVAVGGSNGKSTTKEMAASILATKQPVLKTHGNMNNRIGLPLTLLSMREHHGSAVLEAGISEKGEMDRLAEICAPSVAVLTNVGMAHSAQLGTVEDIAEEKAKLFAGLRPDGIEVINLDDPRIVKYGGKSGRRAVTYSIKEKADVYLKDYVDDHTVMTTRALFSISGREVEIALGCVGMHNLSNAAAAIASTSAMGIDTECVVDGLSRFVPMSGRMEIMRWGGITIINDTYNANPESVEVAVKTVSIMPGRRIAVLGGMHELGGFSGMAHRDVGSIVGREGMDMLVAIGDFKDDMCDGALRGGMEKESVFAPRDKRDTIAVLKEIIRYGDVVLVKGSRAEGMEEIIEELRVVYANCA